MQEELIKQIQQVNGYSDQRQVAELREKILWLNVLDPKNQPVFESARNKGLI